MDSYFQVYWNNLKTNDTAKYEERLRINRERIQRYRKSIYSDKAKHTEYKQKQREKYKARVAAKKVTAVTSTT